MSCASTLEDGLCDKVRGTIKASPIFHNIRNDLPGPEIKILGYIYTGIYEDGVLKTFDRNVGAIVKCGSNVNFYFEGTMNIDDVKTNCDIATADLGNGVHVHGGYLKRFNELCFSYNKDLLAISQLEPLLHFIAPYGSTEVTSFSASGHSLGGAVAQILGLNLCEMIKKYKNNGWLDKNFDEHVNVVTFGSPPIFHHISPKRFKKLYPNISFYHFWDPRDPVSHIGWNIDFKHFGRVIKINPDEKGMMSYYEGHIKPYHKINCNTPCIDAKCNPNTKEKALAFKICFGVFYQPFCYFSKMDRMTLVSWMRSDLLKECFFGVLRKSPIMWTVGNEPIKNLESDNGEFNELLKHVKKNIPEGVVVKAKVSMSLENIMPPPYYYVPKAFSTLVVTGLGYGAWLLGSLFGNYLAPDIIL